MKQFILGDYDFSNVKLIILSNESFLQTRIPIKTTIDINTDKKAFLRKLKDFKEFMQKVHLPNELYSLRDEIVIDIDQFEYRLTLN